jgi:hypothetical protein
MCVCLFKRANTGHYERVVQLYSMKCDQQLKRLFILSSLASQQANREMQFLITENLSRYCDSLSER